MTSINISPRLLPRDRPAPPGSCPLLTCVTLKAPLGTELCVAGPVAAAGVAKFTQTVSLH